MFYNSSVRYGLKLMGALLLPTMLAGCGEVLDIRTILSVADVTTGWLDVGLDSNGRNKLVPTVSFRLENTSNDDVRTLQVHGVFRRCLLAVEGQPLPASDVSPADPEAGTCAGEDQTWGNFYLRAIGREGLEPGSISEPFTAKSPLGYTGEEARLDMLRNRFFVDAKVELFVRHGAEQWVRLGELPIERQLLAQ